MNLYDFIHPLCVDTYRFCSIAVKMNLRETFNILNDTVRYLGNEMQLYSYRLTGIGAITKK